MNNVSVLSSERKRCSNAHPEISRVCLLMTSLLLRARACNSVVRDEPTKGAV